MYTWVTTMTSNVVFLTESEHKYALYRLTLMTYLRWWLVYYIFWWHAYCINQYGNYMYTWVTTMTSNGVFLTESEHKHPLYRLTLMTNLRWWLLYNIFWWRAHCLNQCGNYMYTWVTTMTSNGVFLTESEHKHALYRLTLMTYLRWWLLYNIFWWRVHCINQCGNYQHKLCYLLDRNRVERYTPSQNLISHIVNI